MNEKVRIAAAHVEAHSPTVNYPGPHGIPLLRHAIAGGDAAKHVVEYLQSLA